MWKLSNDLLIQNSQIPQWHINANVNRVPDQDLFIGVLGIKLDFPYKCQWEPSPQMNVGWLYIRLYSFLFYRWCTNYRSYIFKCSRISVCMCMFDCLLSFRPGHRSNWILDSSLYTSLMDLNISVIICPINESTGRGIWLLDI